MLSPSVFVTTFDRIVRRLVGAESRMEVRLTLVVVWMRGRCCGDDSYLTPQLGKLLGDFSFVAEEGKLHMAQKKHVWGDQPNHPR